ncbi:MAG: hypothetical protein K2N94_05000 [Lachnospiraceae bacterium]|nr:hypothetical protein [Lachnospiraceae bacterium]
MLYVGIAAVVLLALLGKSIYDERKYTAGLYRRMEKEWGQVPSEEYSEDKYRSLQFYYNQQEKGEGDIDSITWNDLDMDQIFMTMNNTGSAAGEEYLFAMLHRLSFSGEELAERNRLIEHFSKHRTERQKLQEQFMRMGKERNISIYEYINMLHTLKRESNVAHYLSMLWMLAAIALIFVAPVTGVLAVIIVGIYNAFSYYKRKSDIEKYFTVVSHLIRMMDGMKTLSELPDREIEVYTASVRETLKVFAGFRKGARIVAGKRPTGDLLEGMVDYFRMLFHIDLIKFNQMMKIFDNNEKELTTLFETAGFLDAMIAAASFRALMRDWCVPELVSDGKPFLSVREVYHPMLDEPVKASISEERSVLITGSNASGKSTFIKTLAINAILAQTIGTVMAAEYRASFFQVASSMALRDDIFSKESYYIVEIKSLKRIADRIGDGRPMLCFVDEVLRGTNTLERIAASSEILSDFASGNAICFAATHDIELTHILEKQYSNYHFQEYVEDDQVLFDYKLYEGRAVSKNAIRLLKMLGYADRITERAEERARHFEQTGEWQAFE